MYLTRFIATYVGTLTTPTSSFCGWELVPVMNQSNIILLIRLKAVLAVGTQFDHRALERFAEFAQSIFQWDGLYRSLLFGAKFTVPRKGLYDAVLLFEIGAGLSMRDAVLALEPCWLGQFWQPAAVLNAHSFPTTFSSAIFHYCISLSSQYAHAVTIEVF